jgi:hypothetical protein
MKHNQLIQQALNHARDHTVELKIIYSIKILQNQDVSPEAEEFAVDQLTEFINTPLQITLDL